MKRLALSSVYVGANLLASLAIVILIARSADEDARTAFFLFQALFFPLAALLAQSQMLMRFRNTKLGLAGVAVDAAVFVLTLAALQALEPGLFTMGEAAAYAAAAPLTYRGSTLIAGVQFDESRAVFALLPIITAGTRLGACMLALPLGPAPAFFLSSLAYFLVPLASTLRRRKEPAAPPQKARLPDLLTLFAFFVAASFTFQWERIVLARIGQEALIVASGVCMVWILSPLSAVFATLYRADAQAIFARGDSGFRAASYVRRGAVFLALAALYLSVVAMLWHPLNAVVFPFFEGPLIWPLLLGVAIAADRLGHLAVFTANRLALYRRAAALKVVLVAISIFVVVAIGDGLTLTVIYVVYLGLGFLYLLGVLMLAAIPRPAKSLPGGHPG